MSRMRWTTLGCLGMALMLLASTAPARCAGEALPPTVAEAIQTAFPDAAVGSLERETENGVSYYEVELVLNGDKVEVEVDGYGGIGEVERRVGTDAVPKELARTIAEATKDGGSARVERHERWGVARGDRFAKLDTPRVFFEVEMVLGEGRLSAKWTPSAAASLPEKVAAAIKAAFPRALILDADEDDEDGVAFYEVALIQDGRDFDVEVSADGVLVEVETEASAKDLPAAVVGAIEGAAAGATVGRVEKSEVRAVAKDGTLTMLDPAKVVYEAQLTRGDQRAEIEVAEDGTILEQPEWSTIQQADRDDRDDDEDEEDDD